MRFWKPENIHYREVGQKTEFEIGEKRVQFPFSLLDLEATAIGYTFNYFKHGANGWQWFENNCKCDTKYNRQRRPFSTSCLQNWEYLWKDNAHADTLPTELETSTIDLLIGKRW